MRMHTNCYEWRTFAPLSQDVIERINQLQDFGTGQQNVEDIYLLTQNKYETIKLYHRRPG